MADVINIIQEPVSSTSPTIEIVQPFIVKATGYLTKADADTLYEPILTGAKLGAVNSGITLAKVTTYDAHLINTNNPHSVTKSQIGLSDVENYGQSAVPIESSNLYFTAGGAYTELAKKQNVIDVSHKLSADLVDDTNTTNKFVTVSEKTMIYGSLGNKVVLEIDPSTYVLTATLKNVQNQTIASSSSSVDLPLESMVVSGAYDNSTQSIILTLQSGQTVSFPVADLVSGLQSEITNDNKLSADLISDTNTTNKFVSASEKSQIGTNATDIDALQAGKLDKKTANDEVFEYAYIFYKSKNVDYQGFKYICPGDNKLINAIAKYDENTNLGSGEPVKNSDCATKGYVDYTIDSDLSSTTATINNAIKQTRYVRGTLTELSFTFKMNDDIGTYTLKDGDQIVIEFISGSTATTVTRDTTNAIYNFSTVGANKFVELNAEYKASIGKWVVLSAETPYTAS